MASFTNWDNKNLSPKKKFTRTPKDWLLGKTAGVPEVLTFGKVDGVDYVNVSKHGKSELGQKLSPGYPLEVRVNTPFGPIGTIRNFQDFITRSGYPRKFLSKSVMTHKDVERISSLQPVGITNYWALMAMVLCERVRMSKTLKSLFRKLPKEAVFTSFNSVGNKDLFGKKIQISVSNDRMSIYLSILRNIKIMIDQNRFNTENIRIFVEACKKVPESDLYDGIACEIVVTDVTPVEEDISTIDVSMDADLDRQDMFEELEEVLSEDISDTVYDDTVLDGGPLVPTQDECMVEDTFDNVRGEEPTEEFTYTDMNSPFNEEEPFTVTETEAEGELPPTMEDSFSAEYDGSVPEQTDAVKE